MKIRPKKNRSFPFLLLCLFSVLNLYAQKDFKWSKTVEASPAIPAEFQEADAVMIYEKQLRQTKVEDYRFFSRNIIKRRIKIQTEKGLEEYGRIVIPKIQGMHIEKLDARTIKQDGTIVDLDAKTDIKSIELNDQDDYQKRKYKIFSVQGVAVGDEIEMVCIQSGYTIQWGETVVLNQSIPVLKSDFSVESQDKGIIIVSLGKNGMPDAKNEKNLNSFTLTWSGKNLPGLYEERGNISARSLPHFIYELNADRLYSVSPNIKNWSDLLHYMNDDFYDVRIRKKKKFDEQFEKIMATAESSAKIHRIRAVQKYLNEIELVKLDESEASEGVEYFLEKKKADFNILIKMYKSILDKMEIDYNIAAGRSKYVGPIDLGFPTYLQITDILFLLPDATGSSIVMPTKSKTRSYGLNEIPLELYDTEIYMINPKDKKMFQAVSLGDLGYKRNLRLRKIKGSVNLAEGKIKYNATETISGALSTRYRNSHYNRMENEKMKKHIEGYLEDQQIASLDTVYLSKPPKKDPFRYKLHYNYQTDNQLTKLEDKVYKLTMEHFLDHYIQRANINRLLDYYSPFAYSDGFSYYLEFDQAVKLSNKENLDLSVKNDIGSFVMNVKQVNPTTLLIKSKYILTTNMVAVEHVQSLIDIMDAAEKADNEGIIIELE